jgi:hypothetical protein
VLRDLSCPSTEAEIRGLVEYYSQSPQQQQMSYKIFVRDVVKGMRYVSSPRARSA